VLQDYDNGFWFSPDEGVTWTEISLSDQGVFLAHSEYVHSQAIIIGQGLSHWRTVDSGATFVTIAAPLPPAPPVFTFHPDQPDYLLFHGQRCTSQDTDCEVDVLDLFCLLGLSASLIADAQNSWLPYS